MKTARDERTRPGLGQGAMNTHDHFRRYHERASAGSGVESTLPAGQPYIEGLTMGQEHDGQDTDKETTFDAKGAEQELGEPQRWRAQRDGARDLAFDGWKLAKGESGTPTSAQFDRDWTRGIRCRLWLTTSGKLVAGTHHWTRWEGEHDQFDAQVCGTVDEVLVYLESDEGELGTAEKEAWEAACECYSGLRGSDVEVLA